MRKPPIGLPEWLGRLPAVSVGVALLWLVAGLAVELGFTARSEQAAAEIRAAVDYAIENPAVKVPARLLPAIRAVMPGFESNEMFAFLRDARGTGPAPQEEFDVLVGRAFAILDSHPHRSLGLLPAVLAPHAFATHWMLHSGLLHLLATLAVWLLVAPLLERAWGSGLMAGTLAAAGLLGAGAFTVAHAGGDHALLGGAALVSGAVAALVVRFRGEEVDLLGWLRGFADVELSVPAWGLAIVWVAYEALLWWVVPGTQPPGLGNAAGYTAHAAAALLGGGAALAVARLGWEERFGSPPAPVRPAATQRFDFARILALRRAGQHEQAFALLEAELGRSARNRDAVTTFWQMCIERGEPDRAVAPMQQLLREELRRGADEVAVAQWRELAEHAPSVRLEVPALLRLVPAVRRVDGDESAVVALQQLLEADDAALDASGLASAARFGEELAPELAAQAARRGLALGTLPDGPRLELEQLLARLERGVGVDDDDDAKPEPAQPAQAPPPNVFYEESDRSAFGEVADLSSLDDRFPEGALADAVPRRIEADGIHLRVQGPDGTGESRDLALAYARLRGVAVAGVHGLGPKPVVLIDLLIDGAGSEQPLRVLRMRSDRFSPRRFFPQAGGPLDALRGLVKLILSRCDARPLPDLESAEARPVRVFDDLAEYHERVLRPVAADWA